MTRRVRGPENKSKLRILVLSNVSVDARANPFTVEMIKSLYRQDSVEHVDYGSFWLNVTEAAWDVIVIQWPELIVERGNQSELEALEKRLRYLKQNSKIVTVVHNLRPHCAAGDFDFILYSMIFSVSDATIHLGNSSVCLLQEMYPQVTGKPVVVVPHGNYKCFGPPEDKTVARAKLGLPRDGVVVLVFGELRSKEEFNLALRAIKADLGRNKTLLVAGRVPLRNIAGRQGRVMSYALAALRTIYYFSRTTFQAGVVLHERAIPSRDVPTYVSCADIVLIARRQTLNSGNIALGFTYGKVVVGPDVGNIGEVLKETGNPTYDPFDEDSLDAAMLQARELLSSSLGQQNRQLSDEEWNWDTIAARLVSFFSSLR